MACATQVLREAKLTDAALAYDRSEETARAFDAEGTPTHVVAAGGPVRTRRMHAVDWRQFLTAGPVHLRQSAAFQALAEFSRHQCRLAVAE